MNEACENWWIYEELMDPPEEYYEELEKGKEND